VGSEEERILCFVLQIVLVGYTVGASGALWEAYRGLLWGFLWELLWGLFRGLLRVGIDDVLGVGGGLLLRSGAGEQSGGVAEYQSDYE
jgi:hypothetical protein